MNNHKIKIIILLIVLIGTAVWVTIRQLNNGASDLTTNALAQCLAEKGITMYGANWCPHCQNEKRAFGQAFQFIPYIECPKDPQKCLALNINSYPTWIFPDGRRLEGEQGIKKLSEISGCPQSKQKQEN